MGKFTVYGKEVDDVIEGHMNILRNEIVAAIQDNLISIVLTGGFARGEGSVEIKNGNIEPVNDYDLFVITKKTVPDTLLSDISLRATQKMDIKTNFSFTKSNYTINFYVDLRNMTLDEFKKVIPLLKYYEIKHSGLVIYGEDVLKLMPDFKVEEIPLQDGMRFLFNRMSLLIEYLKPKHLRGEISPEEEKSIIFFAAKSFHSCCEALLLLSGKFVPSYEKRAEIFKETYKKDFPELYVKISDLDRKIYKYTELKLKSHFEGINAIDAWFEAREAIGIATQFYLEKAFEMKPSNNWIDFSKEFHKAMKKKYLQPYLKHHLKNKKGLNISDNGILALSIAYLGQIFMNWLYFAKTKRLISKKYFKIFIDLTDPGLKLYSALPLILFSLSRNEKVNKKMLNEAITYLKKIYPPPNLRKDTDLNFWEDVAEYYTNAFRIYQFLKV